MAEGPLLRPRIVEEEAAHSLGQGGEVVERSLDHRSADTPPESGSCCGCHHSHHNRTGDIVLPKSHSTIELCSCGTLPLERAVGMYVALQEDNVIIAPKSKKKTFNNQLFFLNKLFLNTELFKLYFFLSIE